MIYRQPGKPFRVEIREEIRPRLDEYPETPYISVAGLLALPAFYAVIVALFRVWS
ncbi:MAG TPA: hypothetical protein VMZ53_24360 [Kofleriaceae bacterium]|nr:hypothetical protein [Kofleriaceae bacterium]